MEAFRHVIQDKMGLHIRPASLFAREAGRFEATVTVSKKANKIDGKRIFALLGLGAKQGELITVTVEGADEQAAANSLKALCRELF